MSIRVRRGTAANATSTNPTLEAGEFGYETDTGKIKIGNGTTAWNSLPYSNTPDGIGAEPSLGNPPTDGCVLSSTAAGVRAWVEGGGGGISDAPSDGTTYGRKNAAWVAVTGGGAVSSVNGQTGAVVLDATDVGAVPGVAHTITSDTDVYPKSAPYVLGANNEDILVLNATNYGIYIRLPFEGYPKQITVLMQEDQKTCFIAESDNGTNLASLGSIAVQNDTGWTGTTPTGNTRIIPFDNRGTLVTFAADPNYGIVGFHAFGLIASSHAGIQQLGYGNSPDFTVGVIPDTTISKSPKRWTLSQIEYARVGDAGLWWTWTAPVANAPDIATYHIPDGDFGLDSLGEVWIVSGAAWADTGYNIKSSNYDPAGTAAAAVTTHQSTYDHTKLHDRQHSVTSTSDHTFPGGTTTFLRGDGTFAVPPGGGGGGGDGGFAFKYSFDTSTAGTPSTGTLQLNNAAPASATLLYINETEANGIAIDAIIDDITPPDFLMLSNGDRSKFFVWKVSGTFVSGVGNDYIPVEYQFGTATNFSNAETIYLSRLPTTPNDVFAQAVLNQNARYYMYY